MRIINLSLILFMVFVPIAVKTVEAFEVDDYESYYIAPIEIKREIAEEPQTVNKIIETACEENEIIPLVVEEPEKEYRYIYSAPITLKMQQQIFDICEENCISFEFVMSVIAQESSYRPNVTGDGGKSKGLMQIQERYHGDVMESLGVTDLYDLIGNVKVGVSLLCKYFEECDDVYYVLMKYNGGAAYANRMLEAGKVSDYAKEIVERSMEYERQNGI